MEVCTREPYLGEIRTGRKLGRSPGGRYLYAQCPICKQNRWVTIQLGRTILLCRSCSNTRQNKEHCGVKGYNWKGGRSYNGRGYIKVKRPVGYKGLKDGTILEHRLVWEQANGTFIPDGYSVHHLNGIKDDNRIENLTIMLIKDHGKQSNGEEYKKRIRELEKENRELLASICKEAS